MQELTLFAVRAAVLVLLWVFVLTAVLVVRSDLAGPRRPSTRPRSAASPRPPRPGPRKKGKGKTARRLVVTEGSLAGTTLPLGDLPITIGRAEDSTLVVADEYASSRHARLVPSGDGWTVEDLGSTNGTYLDRQRVTGPTTVPLNRPVRIGKTVLELRR